MKATSWFYSQSFNGRLDNSIRQINAEPIAQAARIIRDKMTGIGDQEVWSTLKNAHEYLWKQIDFSR